MLSLTTEFVYAASSVLCAAVGAAYDIISRRIPNLLTLPAIALGLLLHFSLGGWGELGASALAGLICGGIFLIFYLAGGMGAGDVKLMAAVGCIAGLSPVVSLLICTSFAGGIMALIFALYRRRLKETLVNVLALAVHHKSEGLAPHPDLNLGNAQTLRLPYGLAIAAGSAITLCLSIVQR